MTGSIHWVRLRRTLTIFSPKGRIFSDLVWWPVAEPEQEKSFAVRSYAERQPRSGGCPDIRSSVPRLLCGDLTTANVQTFTVSARSVSSRQLCSSQSLDMAVLCRCASDALVPTVYYVSRSIRPASSHFLCFSLLCPGS